jgi:hypothetical protein
MQREDAARRDIGRELTKISAQEARAALEQGDVALAVSKIVDWLDRFSKK